MVWRAVGPAWGTLQVPGGGEAQCGLDQELLGRALREEGTRR